MSCEITAIAQDNSVHCIVKRPRWQRVYDYYKELADGYTTGELFQSIFENPDPNVFNNSCATRVSLGLLNAGKADVGRAFLVQKGPFKGKKITTSAQGLMTLLLKEWGKPEVQFTVTKDVTTLKDLKIRIGDKTGVYGLWSNDTRWASGHITLWNHNDVVHGAKYTNDAYAGAVSGTVYFWELK